MIPTNTDQHFGRKAFFVFASKRMTAGFIFLVVAAVLLTIRPVLEMLIIEFVGHGKTVVSVSLTLILGCLIISGILFILGILVARVEYRHRTFRLEEYNITYKSGIMSTEEISLPYRQIQTVNITRGVSHQVWGTSKVSLLTAGEEEAGETEKDVVFDPMDKDVANELREALERKIGIQVIQGVTQTDKQP